MLILVKALSGKRVCLDVDPCASIESVRAEVAAREGFAAAELMMFEGQILADGCSLEDYEVTEEAVLEIRASLDGGKKKKRKKKNFTTKKRVPHTRKKEKMKLLKLFKINKDGTVEAQRTECESCKGAFMAKHKDGRQYCGCCHMTK